MFKIPYSFFPTPILRKNAHFLHGFADYLKQMFPFLELNLKQAETDLNSREYLGMCIYTDMIMFVFFSLFTALFARSFGAEHPFIIALIVTLMILAFVFLQQIFYPRLFANRRIKGVERNLLPALQNMLVQLNSGVTLFDTLVSLSKGDYGEVSKEFSKAIEEITAGKPQVEALEDIASINPSLFFRRTIWQIVNGMKSGSDMAKVINEVITSLSDEQMLQIQRYGSQLNPLAMFYMLIAVIIPALSMTFLIIISSFISLSASTTKGIFWGMYGFVVFFQLMFMGIIRSRRPNLLS